LVEVSNEWGFMLDEAAGEDFDCLLVVGHPGKLAKLPAGHWDTHSSRSPSGVAHVAGLGSQVLGRDIPQSTTVEGLFNELPEHERGLLASALAAEIRNAISFRVKERFPVAVVLVNLSGNLLAADGDVTSWK